MSYPAGLSSLRHTRGHVFSTPADSPLSPLLGLPPLLPILLSGVPHSSIWAALQAVCAAVQPSSLDIPQQRVQYTGPVPPATVLGHISPLLGSHHTSPRPLKGGAHQ